MARRCPNRSCGTAGRSLWAAIPASAPSASSGKDAVDEPARRRVIAGQPGTEQPETPPFHILDVVVVAHRIGTASAILRNPPFLGDTLGSAGAADAIRMAAPGKAERRIVG